MSRVLVTGASGFIGASVVRLLCEQGHTVRALLRPTSQTLRIDAWPFERAQGDVRDATSVRSAAQGCDAIVHLASPSSWDEIDSPLLPSIVLGGTQNVLDAARELGGLRVLFCSSAVTLGGTQRPESLDETAQRPLRDKRLRYAIVKRQAEVLCAQAVLAGVPVVIVNPCEVYGPMDTALVTAGNLVDFARSSPVLVCHGGTSVAHVDDIAEGIVAALARGRVGERYVLAGDALPLRELAALTLLLLGQRQRILVLPTWLIRAVTRLGVWLRIPLPFNPRVIPYATRYWFVDARKAREELGVSFRSARETLEPTVRWLRESGRVP